MAAAFGPEGLAVVLLLDRHSSDNRDPAAPKKFEAAPKKPCCNGEGAAAVRKGRARAGATTDHANHMSMRKVVGDGGGGGASRLANFFECGLGVVRLAAEREIGFQLQLDEE